MTMRSARAMCNCAKACALAMFILLIASPVWAGSINFNIGPGGVVVYQVHRKPGPAQGRAIDVSSLGLGSNILPILTGRLNFTTGNVNGSNGGNYTFGAGGSLSVTGCVDLGKDADSKCDKKDFHGVLLTAKFLNAAIVEKAGKFFLDSQILETFNPQLAKLLKLTKNTYLARLELALVQIGRNRWAVQGSPLSGSLFAIPEPSSLLLMMLSLATFLFGGGRMRRLV